MKDSTLKFRTYRRMYTPLTADEVEALTLYAYDQARPLKDQIRVMLHDVLVEKGYLTEDGRAVAWIKEEQTKEQAHEKAA